jgi:hypothetical protein
MIQPSLLNPIHIFKSEEQVFWLNKQNVTANRGNYCKEIAARDTCGIYFESSEATANYILLNCDDFSQVTDGGTPVGGAAQSLGGGIFYVNYVNPPSELNKKMFLFLYGDLNQGDHVLNNVIGTATAVTGSAPPTWISAFINIRNACLLNRIEVEVTVGQEGDYPVRIQVARNGDLKNLETVYETPVSFPPGTYVAGIPIFTNTGWAKAVVWGKGDVMVFSIQNTGDIAIRYNNQGGVKSDNYLGYEFIPSFRYLQPAVRLYGYDGAIGELILTRPTAAPPINYGYYNPDETAEFIYSNKNTYLAVPANTENRLYLPIEFWQMENPQEYEDVEISAGEFVRVRSEQHRMLQLKTDYLPGYMHEKLKAIMSLDVVKINGVEYIQRNPYTTNFNRYYALSKGEVMLTERKSILRNVL